MGDGQFPLGIFSTKTRFTKSLWAQTFWIKQNIASLLVSGRAKCRGRTQACSVSGVSAPAGLLSKKLCLCLHQHSQERRSGNRLWRLLDRIAFSHLVVLWAETFSVFQGASSPPTRSYKYQAAGSLQKDLPGSSLATEHYLYPDSKAGHACLTPAVCSPDSRWRPQNSDSIPQTSKHLKAAS